MSTSTLGSKRTSFSVVRPQILITRTKAAETFSEQSSPLVAKRIGTSWVASAGTIVVAFAGIRATVRTAAQGRKHAKHLATENHQRAHQNMLRADPAKRAARGR
jgi:hypothetical protein